MRLLRSAAPFALLTSLTPVASAQANPSGIQPPLTSTAEPSAVTPTTPAATSNPNVTATQANVATSNPNVTATQANVATSNPNVTATQANVATSNPNVTATQATTNSNSEDCTKEWLRDGFYVRVTNTLGFVNIGGANTDGLSGFGSESLAAFGVSLTRGLVLALNLQSAQRIGTFKQGPYSGIKFRSGEQEINLSRKATVTATKIGALVDWYPLQQYGFHVGVSGGVNFTVMTLHADESILVGSSPYGSLLIGYDWPLSRTVAFGLALVGTAAGSADLKYDGKTESGYSFSTNSIGIGGSFLYF